MVLYNINCNICKLIPRYVMKVGEEKPSQMTGFSKKLAFLIKNSLFFTVLHITFFQELLFPAI